MVVTLSRDGGGVAGIALSLTPPEGEPWAGLEFGWGGGLPSKVPEAGRGVGGHDSMLQSLMTQAWAGGQTDIFSEEKLLWCPPSGTALSPASRRGGLGTKPRGVGM